MQPLKMFSGRIDIKASRIQIFKSQAPITGDAVQENVVIVATNDDDAGRPVSRVGSAVFAPNGMIELDHPGDDVDRDKGNLWQASGVRVETKSSTGFLIGTHSEMSLSFGAEEVTVAREMLHNKLLIVKLELRASNQWRIETIAKFEDVAIVTIEPVDSMPNTPVRT